MRRRSDEGYLLPSVNYPASLGFQSSCDPRVSLPFRIWRAKVIPDRRLSEVTSARREDGVALLDEVVCRPRSQCLNGEAGIRGPLRGHNAAVADEQVRNVVGAAKTVDHRRR